MSVQTFEGVVWCMRKYACERKREEDRKKKTQRDKDKQ